MRRVKCRMKVYNFKDNGEIFRLHKGGTVSLEAVGEDKHFKPEDGRVARTFDLQAGPVYSEVPGNPNNAFWAATPNGQLQLFGVENISHLGIGTEFDLYIVTPTED